MATSLSSFGRIISDGMREYQHDKEILSPRQFRKKWPPRPTPQQERAARTRKANKIREAGGTPWQVWGEGYKGMGPSIPVCLGVVSARNFKEACKLLDPDGAFAAYDGPLHSSEKEAWAAYDAHWAAIGGVYAPRPDYRRPKG